MKLISVILVAFLLLPSQYNYGECEKVMKDFRDEYGGYYVFIQPLKDSGAYDLGEYHGHWINKLYIRGNEKDYYFDYQEQRIFGSIQEVKDYWMYKTGEKSEVFDFEFKRPPFGIIWHY